MKKEKRYAIRLTCCRKTAARYTRAQIRDLIAGTPVAPLTCPACCSQVGVGRGSPAWYSDEYSA